MHGKKIRLERIIDRNSKKTVLLPLDHGAGMGPIDGLVNLKDAVDWAAEGGANAVIGHLGLALHGHRSAGKDVGLILHFSVSTELNPVDGDEKVPVNNVQTALKMGADAVSIHVNFGSETEAEQLRVFGKISTDCLEWGMPLLVMAYPRGPKIDNPNDVKNVKLVARIAAELGADIIKVPYTGDSKSFEEVVKGALDVPVVIAGGAKGNDLQALKNVEGAIAAGGAGVAMGRNAFQHKNPANFIKATAAVVHGGRTAEEAMREFLK
ncbi:2-amino-3,7-dideoxy-D-threo-hept-6-ulosonate synthase [Patescibacteria group bacterium]|nr:2-amino-3,7-dideoxy-D-threo-hept-6-ulosonate synthase [Patescibacteria group bacterium]